MKLQRQRGGARRVAGVADGIIDHLASRLVRAPLAELSHEIGAALEAIGLRVRADRVTLWDPCWGEQRSALLQEWARPGCEVAVGGLEHAELPWLIEQVLAGRRVAFRSCAALPGEAVRERRLFARHGPRSAAILPVVVGDTTIAVLVAGTVRRERGWGPAVLAFLERAADVLATALVRARAHEASLATEGHLGGVLEAGHEGFLLLRPSGRVEVANGRATEIFHRKRDELCGAFVQDLFAPAQGTPPRWRTTIDALLASDRAVELAARRGDGSSVPVEVTLRELRTPGEPLLCCAVRDVTEEQRAREETRGLRNEIAFMGRTAMLAEMGSGIAHELNQPLTAILSNAETAERLLRAEGGAALDDVRETLADVVADTRRAAEVLGRMREMLRRKDIERVPVDVAALLQRAGDRFREEAIARSIRISVEVPARLPPVIGDPVQLEQVATNLVLNAVEAMGDPDGAPRTIVLRARPTEPEGVDVSVRDTGPGLGEEALARAFEAFFTTKPSGLGMGLRISRWIVEAHGGRLLGRNNPDRGATFEFHLPAAPHRAAAARWGRPA